MNRRKSNNGGFTFVELIVTSLIIGILSRIGTPALMTTVRRVEAGAARHVLSNIYKECYANINLDASTQFNLPKVRGYRIFIIFI